MILQIRNFPQFPTISHREWAMVIHRLPYMDVHTFVATADAAAVLIAVMTSPSIICKAIHTMAVILIHHFAILTLYLSSLHQSLFAL